MVEPDVDLVVAGAGGGLVGALRAARQGLEVLLVEASEHYRQGNNTSMSTAMIPGTGTRWQREQGVEDSPETFVGDVAAKTKGTGDLALARALAEASPRMLEWLADDLGVPLSLVTDFGYPGHSEYRCHTVPDRHGSTLLGHLVRAAAAEPRIHQLVPARVSGVELDDSGRAAIVTVTRPDGELEQVSAGAVLLATNGFGADRTLVARHLPEIADAVYHGSEASRGDALRIGGELGAATAFLDAYQGHAALSERGATLVGWATVMHGAVLVDLDGVRFGDETVGYSEYAAALASRRGASGWLVYDERVHEACLPFKDYRQSVEVGSLVRGADVAELASRTGLPEAALAATLAAAGAAASGRVPDPWGRQHFEAPLDPPYVAVRVVPALFHTQGGLVVDGDARVLRADGTPIDGLYASGGAAAGISGHGASGYLAGNGLLTALGLAFLAAEHVAAQRPAEIVS
ncbi:FAD-binding protein [Nocardioides sp. W7]|uniref:FAD-dependent oxidoreductase n=1 Tax=Nocardioides sp. W7 TaxID=2931390 RepID=UPI001FD22FE4|nr:FAD-binding protein [Nocardioides sp. W7]